MEQGFCLMFGIRRLDPDRLGTVARSALDATARHIETSFPGGSDIGSFDLERFGELINRVAGLADLSGLTDDRDNAKPYRIKTAISLTVLCWHGTRGAPPRPGQDRRDRRPNRC